MKLQKIHIFIILLTSLIFCCIGFSVFEGFDDQKRLLIDPNTRKSAKPGSPRTPDNWYAGGLVEGEWNVVGKSRQDVQEENFLKSQNKDTYQSIVKSEDNLKGAIRNINTISKSDIPKGKEHLYIKKSQVIIPVCPKCPTVKKCDTTKDCPPCPEFQPCPNKPFTCKMVPKWKSPNVYKHLPRPILNSFDKFNDK